MKRRYIVLASVVLMSLSTYAQKDELKALKKIYAKEMPSAADFQAYKDNLAKLETLATLENDKVATNFYKSMQPLVEMSSLGKNITPAQMSSILSVNSIAAIAKGIDETLEYEKKTGKKVFTNDIQETVTHFKPMVMQFVIALDKNKNYKDTASVLHSVYLMDKKDAEKLYYAANYAVMAQDYDNALTHYEELVKLNYSGEGTIYWAKNVANGQEEAFPNKEQRTQYIGLGSHAEPRDEKIPSKRGEIYKNIALIYVQKGKSEQAKKAFKDARATNPDDVSLIVEEANLYFQAKDMETYKRLVSEALAKDPNNGDLYYNLGVVSYNNKEYAEAEKYYLKAIQINPNNEYANLNLAILKMEPEKKLVEQMNKLGTTPAENKKYEALKKQREDIMKSAIPYLEKVVQLNPSNEEAGRTLLGVYRALEMTDKAKALKTKMGL